MGGVSFWHVRGFGVNEAFCTFHQGPTGLLFELKPPNKNAAADAALMAAYREKVEELVRNRLVNSCFSRRTDAASFALSKPDSDFWAVLQRGLVRLLLTSNSGVIDEVQASGVFHFPTCFARAKVFKRGILVFGDEAVRDAALEFQRLVLAHPKQSNDDLVAMLAPNAVAFVMAADGAHRPSNVVFQEAVQAGAGMDCPCLDLVCQTQNRPLVYGMSPTGLFLMCTHDDEDKQRDNVYDRAEEWRQQCVNHLDRLPPTTDFETSDIANRMVDNKITPVNTRFRDVAFKQNHVRVARSKAVFGANSDSLPKNRPAWYTGQSHCTGGAHAHAKGGREAGERASVLMRMVCAWCVCVCSLSVFGTHIGGDPVAVSPGVWRTQEDTATKLLRKNMNDDEEVVGITAVRLADHLFEMCDAEAPASWQHGKQAVWEILHIVGRSINRQCKCTKGHTGRVRWVACCLVR
jgi:hypothetical protein